SACTAPTRTPVTAWASPSWRAWSAGTAGASGRRAPSGRARRSILPFPFSKVMGMEDRETDVLLVEDDSNDVAVALRALQRHSLGTRVKVLRDGAELLDYLEHVVRNTPPKLILLDLKMPRLDGRAALRELRTRDSTRHVPVVVVSSSSQ